MANESGYQRFAQATVKDALEKAQAGTTKAAAGLRRSYFGGSLTIGSVGLLGGILEAVDIMENRELVWMISVAVYAALILAAGCYLLWNVVRVVGDNDTSARAALDDVITRLLTLAGNAPLPGNASMADSAQRLGEGHADAPAVPADGSGSAAGGTSR
jgi:hypothetical protein